MLTSASPGDVANRQVFVVDAADAPRVEEAKSAFVKASGAKDLKGAPILVLANKHDTLLQVTSHHITATYSLFPAPY